MKKQIPAILLSIICITLVITLHSQRRQNTRLVQKIAALEGIPEQPALVKTASAVEQSANLAQAGAAKEIVPLEESFATDTESQPAPEPGSQEESNRRMMRNMAKMIEENPTINKMVEASQRGAIGALYSDMIEYLDLDAEEAKYFMDLLMYRQMANVDAHMKMASGNLSDEEKLALQEEVKRVNETTRSEMEGFLNDSDDFEEFKFYEDTIGERMMLSQMDQKLAATDASMSDKTYREVLEVMHEERQNYDWSTDLHDQENRDMSPERFSKENIQNHIKDIKILGEQMDRRIQEILTPEQLAAWRESGVAMQTMAEGQLMQANQMFGGGEKATTP